MYLTRETNLYYCTMQIKAGKMLMFVNVLPSVPNVYFIICITLISLFVKLHTSP